MKKIICRDSCELSHSADKIFEAVADVGTYNEWWGGVKVKVIENKTGFTGSKVEIKSNGGKFCCEITDIDQPRSVGVDYYKGVVRGKGT